MELEQLTKIFKALSNEQRLKLYKMIYEWQSCTMGPDDSISCCGAIDKAFTKACCALDLSRSTVSHHLKELQNAGLIDITRKGKTASVKIREDAIKAIHSFL